jgi:ribonuclease HII
MQKAVDKLLVKPDLVLIDGRDEPLKCYNQQHLIKGDSLSYSVAAASILAKVTRDRIMNYYHNYYPIYGFRDNKGYATRKHMSIIQETGRSTLHRKTFLLPFEKSGGQLFLDL